MRPTPRPRSRPRSDGFTLIELIFASALLFLLVGGVASSFWTTQFAVQEQQTRSQLQRRARLAMDRLVEVVGRARTTDPVYGPADPVDQTITYTEKTIFANAQGMVTERVTADLTRSLSLREVREVVDAAPVLEDVARIHVLSEGGPVPCLGVVIGRGPDPESVWEFGAGPDGLLGTSDDRTDLEYVPGIPIVENVLAPEFAPERGEMLTILIDQRSNGRLLTITLRANARNRDGSLLSPDDLVLTERVALPW